MIQYRFKLFVRSYIAAVRIQSQWRGYQARKIYEKDIKLKIIYRKVAVQQVEINKLKMLIQDMGTRMEALTLRTEVMELPSS
jgi:hypothetical protein